MGNKQRKIKSVFVNLSGRFPPWMIFEQFFTLVDPLVVHFSFLILSLSRITVYSSRAPNTNIMQAITQHSIAVKPSAWNKNFKGSVRENKDRHMILVRIINNLAIKE